MWSPSTASTRSPVSWTSGPADTELVRAAGTVEALREVKDAGELALLRLACEAADAALADLVERGGLRPGRTEREVSRELEALMLDHGADAISFETIVAAGPNSAIPHHRPTDAVLARGDFVKIDFGALVAGYHSDMTRTFVLGKAADWQLEIYQLVADAQRAGREALRPGAGLRDVDGAARQLIVDAGYGEHFGHGLGHGVGLQIHEAPGIGATSAGTLLAGSVVTVEPGVYLPGRGGVRIEDTLVVAGDANRARNRRADLGTADPVPQRTGHSDLACATRSPASPESGRVTAFKGSSDAMPVSPRRRAIMRWWWWSPRMLISWLQRDPWVAAAFAVPLAIILLAHLPGTHSCSCSCRCWVLPRWTAWL